MRCPFCHATQSQVLETRDADGAVRRRRACQSCGRRFTTYERVEGLALTVRKRDGSAQPFDREKLLRGLVRAAAKRPVTVPQLERVVDAVARELLRAGGELGSERIGELVLRRLRGLDPVAYVRFASVYRNFADVREFEAELARLDGTASVRPRGHDRRSTLKSGNAAAGSRKRARAREE